MKNFRFYFVFFVLLFSLPAAHAQEMAVEQLGSNLYVAGVPSEAFEYFAAPRQNGRQRQQNWCWAACAQMVLNYHGLYVRQEQIVERIYGQLVDRPADVGQIRYALSGYADNTQGGRSEIFCEEGAESTTEIAENLAYRWPLIVGLTQPDGSGHAYVLTAIYFSFDSQGEVIPHKVVLRDPWPHNKSRQEMRWADFERRLTMLFKVWVQ